MHKKSIFKALDFFIVRTPTLPVNVFENELTSFNGSLLNKLWKLSKDPLIREAIAVSSKSLFDSMKFLSPNTPNNKREQVAKSFLKYLIRMSTRATPFGVFSGVTYGSYGDEFKFKLKAYDNYKKRTRPDMEWIFKVIASIEDDIEILPELFVIKNAMSYEVGNRTYLTYLTCLDKVRKKQANSSIERLSISTTRVVEEVFSLTEKPIRVKELVLKLKDEYPDVSQEQILQFIYQLIRQELLISNLRPPLLDTDPLKYLITCIKNIEIREIRELREKLEEILLMIEQYDKLKLGDGEKLYNNIIRKMKSIADSKNFVQVDLKIENEEITLPISIKEELEEVADVMWKISDDKIGLSHMLQYRNDFIEKYGFEREVPLMELLDEEIGLGSPATYEYPPSNRKQENNITEFQRRKNYLLSQWIMMCLINDNQEITLDNEKLEELIGDNVNSHYAPSSFEMYFSLICKSKEEMKKGQYKFICGATPLSYGAGKSIGRFSDIMGSKFNNYLKDIGIKEKDMYPDKIIAELSYLPITSRAANVVLTYDNRDYEVIMGTTPSKSMEKTIMLSDLVVGIDKKGFYLRSIKLGKEVIISTNHMLNTLNAPNVYRFLRELSQERQRNVQFFEWGDLERLPFLPRVRYKNCIISSARWILNFEVGSFKKDMNEEEWINEFNIYRKKFNIPRYVYLTEGDSRLLLDLNDTTHLNQIYKEFNKLGHRQGIRLVEMGNTLNDLPYSDKDRYCIEFVFPVMKRLVDNTEKVMVRKCNKIIDHKKLLRLPGSDCLFIKWYGLGYREDEFLSYKLKEFCNLNQENKVFKECFFMRYADPDKHLRLRFFGEAKVLQSELLPKINRFSNDCLEEGLLSRMVIDTYDPEVERYGGEELIKIAEKWFCIDSEIIMSWLKLIEDGVLCISKDLLAVISIIDIMDQFGIEFEEQFDLLDKMVDYKKYLDLFRKEKSIYLKLANSNDNFAGLKEHEVGQFILPFFEQRRKILNYYAMKISEQEKGGEIHIDSIEITSSIIHLHINRLYGINREDENRVLTLVRHTLHGLSYIRKRCNNEK